MNDLTVTGNLVEAGLWALFAVCFAVMAHRAKGPRRRLWGVLAVAFLAFGISDVIEARTGAWWRPVGLLLLKTGCVGVFLWGAHEYRRIRRSQP